MKKQLKYMFVAVAALSANMLMTSCSEDSYYKVDINGVPEASAYADAVKITVDQSTNIATFEFTAPGVYPIWVIDGKDYSSNMKFTRFYRKAGEYSVDVKVGNGNGISNGTLTKTFNIDKTKMNGFGGFVYESEYNLWTKANRQINSFYYAPGWSEIDRPEHTFDGDTFTLTLTEATTDQWQAQMHVGTDICLPAGEHYDGSAIFTTTKDINNITMKIHPDGDDDDNHSFFASQKINLTAGEPAAFFFSDLEAKVDMNNVVYTFDFGGNPAGIEIIIENIVLKKHSDDDGTVLPEIPTEPEPNWVAYDSEENLLYSVLSEGNYTMGYYYAPNWNQIADPGFTDNGDGSFTFTLPEATFDQWQAQCYFATTLPIEDPDVEYDFCCYVESNVDQPGITFKLTDLNSDNNFFFADREAVPGGTSYKFWRSKCKLSDGTAAEAMNMFFDFGGNPAGSEIKVSKMILQKHHD